MDQMVEGQDLPYDLGDCLRCDAGGIRICKIHKLGLDSIMPCRIAGGVVYPKGNN